MKSTLLFLFIQILSVFDISKQNLLLNFDCNLFSAVTNVSSPKHLVSMIPIKIKFFFPAVGSIRTITKMSGITELSLLTVFVDADVSLRIRLLHLGRFDQSKVRD